MSKFANAALVVFAGAFGLAVGVQSGAFAQNVTKDVVGDIANNEGYFVDGKTFKIVHGAAKGDVSAAIAKLNAKEIGPGIIVFRSGDKLYVALPEAPPSPQAMKEFQEKLASTHMQAMKNFQDQWTNTYMKNFQDQWTNTYMKSFQDQWTNTYMKDFQDQWTNTYMKNFQDQWTNTYMKNFQDQWTNTYMKNFQDQWTNTYMKNFQDNWTNTYMNSVKNFQDNWTTTYMK